MDNNSSVLGIQRAADRQALNRNAVLAEQQRRYGVLRDPEMIHERSVLGSLPLDIRQPTPQDMRMGTEQVMNMMPMAGITAFHGSPHLFNKFDMSKIGTGEGAQAYGHGLYFAENPKVAEDYARKLARDHIQYTDPVLDKYNPIWKGLSIQDKQLTQKIANAKNQHEFNRLQDTRDKVNDEMDRIQKIMIEEGGKQVKAQKSLYKVDIPDDQIAKMLDWDKPLSESLVKRVPGTKPSPEQQIIRSAVREGKTGSELYDDLMYFYKSNDTAYQDAIKQPLADRYNNPIFTGRGDAPYQAQASRYLKEQGIPGIKYLDQGSRQGGKGTSNFVLFDDQIPQILAINDKPVRGILGGQ